MSDVIQSDTACVECKGTGFSSGFYPIGTEVGNDCETCFGTGRTTYRIASSADLRAKLDVAREALRRQVTNMNFLLTHSKTPRWLVDKMTTELEADRNALATIGGNNA